MSTAAASPVKIRSLADSFVRYDLAEMRREARVDFSPESGSQRLLKQNEISARFRKRPKGRGAQP
jgi:hypothetical protein